MPWIESIPIGIASVALIISAWTLRAQQTHNKLTVQPLLVFLLAPSPGQWEVIVKNVGLGPAIIKDKTSRYKNQTIRFDSWNTFKQNVVNELIDDGGFNGHCDPIIEGTVIEPGDTHIFFNVSWDKSIRDQSLGEKILPFLENTFIKISYTSIYEQSFEKRLTSLMTSEACELY